MILQFVIPTIEFKQSLSRLCYDEFNCTNYLIIPIIPEIIQGNVRTHSSNKKMLVYQIYIIYNCCIRSQLDTLRDNDSVTNRSEDRDACVRETVADLASNLEFLELGSKIKEQFAYRSVESSLEGASLGGGYENIVSRERQTAAKSELCFYFIYFCENQK